MGKGPEVERGAYGFLPQVNTKADLFLVRSKSRLFSARVSYMLLRAMEIFEWKDLPATLDPRALELYLLTQGYALIVKCDSHNSSCGSSDDKPEGIYALAGGIGGELDASYFPTLGIPVSPYLDLHIDSKEEQRLGKAIALVRSDANCVGLMPMMSLYGGEQAEAFLTLRLQLVNLRTNKLLQADSDSVKEDAKSYLRKIDEEGELGVIGSKKFFDMLNGIKTEDYSSGSAGQSVKDTIEAIQYLDGKWFNELGLNATFNMKREAINDDEVGAGEDTLFPLIDDMLQWRKKGAEEINRIFGTSISVDLKSSWKKVMEERLLSVKKELAETKEAMLQAQAENEALKQAKTDEGQNQETPEMGETPTPSDENDSSGDSQEEKKEGDAE